MALAVIALTVFVAPLAAMVYLVANAPVMEE